MSKLYYLALVQDFIIIVADRSRAVILREVVVFSFCGNNVSHL